MCVCGDCGELVGSNPGDVDRPVVGGRDAVGLEWMGDGDVANWAGDGGIWLLGGGGPAKGSVDDPTPARREVVRDLNEWADAGRMLGVHDGVPAAGTAAGGGFQLELVGE